MTGYEVQQSTTAYPLVFLLISSTDHISGLTGATVTVTISKAGAAFGSPAGSVTEIGSGWYKVAGSATDTNTLGPLALHATATGSDPTDVIYPVVAVNPQSATGFVTSVPTVVGAVGSVTGNIGGSVASVTGAVGSVAGNVSGSVASVVGAVGSVTGITFPTNFGALSINSSGQIVLSATGADAVLVEGTINLPQAMALAMDAVISVLSGVPTSGSGTILVKDPTGTHTRGSISVDGAGNRTAVTLTPPSV